MSHKIILLQKSSIHWPSHHSPPSAGLRAYTIVKAYRQRLHLLDRRTCVAVIAFPSDVVSVATSHPNILWAACQSGSLYRVPIEGNEHARLVQVKDEQHLVATNAGVHCISFFQSHLFACGLLEAITVYSFDGDGVLRGVSPLLEEKEEFVTHVLAVKPNDVLVSLLGEGKNLWFSVYKHVPVLKSKES